jgi:hypothetical protein
MWVEARDASKTSDLYVRPYAFTSKTTVIFMKSSLPICNSMQSSRSPSTFQRNILSPPSGQNKPSKKLGTHFLLLSCLAYSYSLKMEAVDTLNTLANFYQTTHCDTPENSAVHSHCCETFEFIIAIITISALLVHPGVV